MAGIISAGFALAAVLRSYRIGRHRVGCAP